MFVNYWSPSFFLLVTPRSVVNRLANVFFFLVALSLELLLLAGIVVVLRLWVSGDLACSRLTSGEALFDLLLPPEAFNAGLVWDLDSFWASSRTKQSEHVTSNFHSLVAKIYFSRTFRGRVVIFRAQIIIRNMCWSYKITINPPFSSLCYYRTYLSWVWCRWKCHRNSRYTRALCSMIQTALRRF